MAKSKYQIYVKPKLERLTEWYLSGDNDEQVAEKLSISITSFYDYQHRYPEFSETVKKAKEHRVEKVEDTIYRRAFGYEYTEVKTNAYADSDEKRKTFEVRTTKHIPGDVTALIFILKNKTKDQYSDRQEFDVKGFEGIKLIQAEKDL